MTVLVVGASGFIGAALVEALRCRGHAVVACSRRPRPEVDGVRWLAGDLATDSVAQWHARLEGVTVAVNAAGVFQGAALGAVHDDGPRRLFDACAERGVKVIQISAIGAERERPPTEFLASKQRADHYLLGLGIPAAVLYPGLVAGAGGASFRLFCALAALPLVPVPNEPGLRLPVVTLDQLCTTVTTLVDAFPDHPVARPLATWLPPGDYLRRVRQWLRLPPVPQLDVPLAPMAWLFRLFPALRLGLLDRHSLAMLRLGAPPSHEETTASAALPADLALAPELRRAAALHFLPGLALASLVFLWCWTALCSVANPEVSLELTRQFGIADPTLGLAAILFGAVLDGLLGVALLLRRRRRQALAGQLLLMLAYSLLIALFLPAQWFHPFGPLSKNVQIFILTLGLWQHSRSEPPSA